MNIQTLFLYILIILGLTPFQNQLFAQNILSYEDVRSQTLENNFGIRIAKNSVVIAENSTALRANGYLPSVSASGGLNSNFGSSSQQFSTGQEANVSNAFTWGANASVRADYTLFDARRGITVEQLKESLAGANLQLRQSIEQNIFQALSQFFLISQLQENVALLEETLDVSRDRVRRAEIQLELGLGSGLNILNARVDVQRDSINLINALNNLQNEKTNLNVIVGRRDDINYNVELPEEMALRGTLEEYLAKAKKQNINLILNQQNLVVNEMNLDLIDAESRPTVNMGASVDLSYSDNPAGAFIERSNSRVLAGNVGVNWTIFDGSRTIRRQNAVLNVANQKLGLDQLEEQLERDVRNAWRNYLNDLYLIEVQESAVRSNEENFERTREQFNNGRISSVEFRQAQLNLLLARTNLNTAKINLKLRVLQLDALTGELIRD